MKNSFTLIIVTLMMTTLNAKETGCISGDCMNGYGTVYYENGEKYVGEFVVGKKDGVGVYIYTNNEKFVGTWKKNQRVGVGKFYQNNELKIVGFWESDQLIEEKNYLGTCLSGNCQSGIGVFLSENGTRLMGRFSKGKLNGKGIAYYLTGEKYICSVRNNQKHGIGTLYSSLETINGTFTEDRLIGTNRDVKIGCKTGNCIDGNGTFIYSDNTIYEGEFFNGQPNGYGICYFADGDIYVGNWKDNFFEGNGTFYYSNGEILAGDWKGSYLIKAEERSKVMETPTRSINEVAKVSSKKGKVRTVIVLSLIHI